jgi:hypothetical protein
VADKGEACGGRKAGLVKGYDTVNRKQLTFLFPRCEQVLELVLCRRLRGPVVAGVGVASFAMLTAVFFSSLREARGSWAAGTTSKSVGSRGLGAARGVSASTPAISTSESMLSAPPQSFASPNISTEKVQRARPLRCQV